MAGKHLNSLGQGCLGDVLNALEAAVAGDENALGWKNHAIIRGYESNWAVVFHSRAEPGVVEAALTFSCVMPVLSEDGGTACSPSPPTAHMCWTVGSSGELPFPKWFVPKVETSGKTASPPSAPTGSAGETSIGACDGSSGGSGGGDGHGDGDVEGSEASGVRGREALTHCVPWEDSFSYLQRNGDARPKSGAPAGSLLFSTPASSEQGLTLQHHTCTSVVEAIDFIGLVTIQVGLSSLPLPRAHGSRAKPPTIAICKGISLNPSKWQAAASVNNQAGLTLDQVFDQRHIHPTSTPGKAVNRGPLEFSLVSSPRDKARLVRRKHSRDPTGQPEYVLCSKNCEVAVKKTAKQTGLGALFVCDDCRRLDVSLERKASLLAARSEDVASGSSGAGAGGVVRGRPVAGGGARERA